MNSIARGMSNSNFTKVMNIKTTKEMWDKLISIYQGDDQVKNVKLQTLRRNFESLKMNEEEVIAT